MTNDLRYDYSEEELGFCFDDSSPEGVLHVYLYDVVEGRGNSTTYYF